MRNLVPEAASRTRGHERPRPPCSLMKRDARHFRSPVFLSADRPRPPCAHLW